MLHDLRLIVTFIRAAIQQEMAFRANFFINLLGTVLDFVAGISGMLILFSQVVTLQGWAFPQALALLGVYQLIGALRTLFIGPSLETLGGQFGEIFAGSFDFTLLKPVHTQFLVSFRAWRLWSLVDLLLSIIILGTACAELGEQMSLLRLATFLLALCASLTILYSIMLMLASLMFWYQGTSFLMIFDGLVQLGRYPVGIYPHWLRLLLLWVVPLGLITTLPVEALTGRVTAATLGGGVALAVGLLVLASVLFRLSLRRYVGASS